MTEKEYIERAPLLEKAWDVDCRAGYVQVVDVGDIQAVPAADVAPVRHGAWSLTKDCAAHCSFCDRKMNVAVYGYMYCPMCGAKMDLEG